MSESNFNLKPLRGYGKFLFGMSITQARSFEPIYGETKERSLYPQNKSIQFVLNMAQTDEQRNDILGAIEAMEDKKELYQLDFSNTIRLVFKSNKLVEITISKREFPVILNGKDIFSLNGASLVEYIGKELNENPYIEDRDVYFQKNDLSLFGYTIEVENNIVLWDFDRINNDGNPYSLTIYNKSSDHDADLSKKFMYKIL